MYLGRAPRTVSSSPGVGGGCSVFVLFRPLPFLANTHTLRTPDLTLFPQTRLPGPDLCQGWRGGEIRITAHNLHHQPPPPPIPIPSTTGCSHFFFIKARIPLLLPGLIYKPKVERGLLEHSSSSSSSSIVVVVFIQRHALLACLPTCLPACLATWSPACCLLLDLIIKGRIKCALLSQNV